MTMGNLTTAFILPSIKCKLQSYTKLKIKKKKVKTLKNLVGGQPETENLVVPVQFPLAQSNQANGAYKAWWCPDPKAS